MQIASLLISRVEGTLYREETGSRMASQSHPSGDLSHRIEGEGANSPEGERLPLASPGARPASAGCRPFPQCQGTGRKPGLEGPREPSTALGLCLLGPRHSGRAPAGEVSSGPGEAQPGSLGLGEVSRPEPQPPSSANVTSLSQPTSVGWLLKNDLIFAISQREGAPN